MACYLTTNNYQKNEKETYLQNYTTNHIQVFMNTQNTFPANNAEENYIDNSVNDIEMGGVFDEGGVGTGLTPFDDSGSADVFGFGEMAIDPTLLNEPDLTNGIDDEGMGTGSAPCNSEAVAGSTEDSHATGVKEHHPSEVDNDG